MALVFTPTQQPTSTPTAAPTEEVQTVTFIIVYDNYACAPTTSAPALAALRNSWGFGCWVETEEKTVLFDTGGDGATLMNNLTILGLDPQTIDVVVLSHAHGDHTGGLAALLGAGAKPTVYVPASFSAAFKRDVRRFTDLVEVAEPVSIAPGIHTTGEVGTSIIEQALAVETDDGLVVVTGCAHPGVVEMVRRAKVAVAEGSGMPGAGIEDRVALVMGGFHLGSASRARVKGIIADFRNLSVQRVAPCHCTGDQARRLFAESFGTDCVLVGVGWSTRMPVHD
jgi:7,8-dihydropterin-6-yl-methyl-4-(beta-D-ribofuranosyl)aminobenzene 5'-phosphate synthase